jgi:3-oxoadipate enol-lactonase/4-carboxymuconolactone decarboxylase
MPLQDLVSSVSYYRLEGADGLPVLMLAHSLGLDHGMWDAQAAELSAHFQVLRYDIRGHGASEVVAGDYTIEQLGREALALADALGIDRFAFCGLSLGGMIGLWLGRHAPERVTALVLANTSARPGRSAMETRREAVRSGGMSAVVELVMARFFLPRTLAGQSAVTANARRTLAATNPIGYMGCCAAIRDVDLSGALSEVLVPTLVIGSDADLSFPWNPHGQHLFDGIPGARAAQFPTAHISNLELPRTFLALLYEFLLPISADAHAAGLQTRRRVLGDAHVDRALATSVSPDFQRLITAYAWGSIWSRPGLDIRTRRLLALAIAAATNRWDEFRLHVRTGLARELEWCDLEDALLETAIYAGVPAANTGFHLAAEERNATKP